MLPDCNIRDRERLQIDGGKENRGGYRIILRGGGKGVSIMGVAKICASHN